jgi:hypothetical protein
MKGFGRLLMAILLVMISLCSAFWAGTKWKVPGSPPEMITIHDTIPGDSIPYSVVSYVPVWDSIMVTDTIPSEIDTAAILKDYFVTRVYKDTITDDTSFLAIIRDEISQNRITNRNYSHQNLRATIINTTTIFAAPKVEVGPYLGYGLKVSIGVEGLYRPPGGRKSFVGSLGTDGVRIGIRLWVK